MDDPRRTSDEPPGVGPSGLPLAAPGHHHDDAEALTPGVPPPRLASASAYPPAPYAADEPAGYGPDDTSTFYEQQAGPPAEAADPHAEPHFAEADAYPPGPAYGEIPHYGGPAAPPAYAHEPEPLHDPYLAPAPPPLTDPPDERYSILPLMGVVLVALIGFCIFFLGFLVAPLAVLIIFYVVFSAIDRNKGKG